MSALAPVPPLGGVTATPLALQLGQVAPPVQPGAAGGFGEMVMAGLRGVDDKLDRADAMVHRFALDDSVPVHQVTMALEEARLAVDLAMQVRSRLVEGYRDLMAMQL